MKKILITIIGCLVILWSGIFAINIYRANNLQQPFLLIPVSEIQKDGGSATYGGLGYKFNIEKQMSKITKTKLSIFGKDIANCKSSENLLEQNLSDQNILSFDTIGIKLKVPKEIFDNCKVYDNTNTVVLNEGNDMIFSFDIAPNELYEDYQNCTVLIDDYQDKYTIFISKPTCGTLNNEDIQDLWNDLTKVQFSLDDLIIDENAPLLYNVYRGNNDADGLDYKVFANKIEKIQDLVNIYAKYNDIIKNIQVLSVDDNVIDMNEQFGELLKSTGTAGEFIYTNGFAKTICEYYGFDEIYITVEGEILETGHTIYDFPIKP